MKQLILVTLVITTLFGCKKDTSNCVYAYLGGEIINPNNDYVILEGNNGVIDTLLLDENNRFFRKIENLESGIYTLVHGGEYQVVVLEPKDSILVRLNTLAFDESIVFTGLGAKKNNFLIKLFLDIEDENDKMLEISRLDPEIFSKTLITEKDRRTEGLNQLIAKYKTSPLFNGIAQATINYNYYANKEMYPFRNFGDYNIKKYKSLPKDFYDYRQYVSYDNDYLKDYFPYYSFLFSHFNNLALDNYFTQTKDSIFKRRSLTFNLERIRLMDSLITHDSIKNVMLKYAVRDFINYSKKPNETEQILQSYLKRCNNEGHKKYIIELADALTKLQKGKRLPSIDLIDTHNKITKLENIITRPTVISFWSSAIKSHFKDNHKRVQELKIKYPNIDFISININANNSEVWKQMLKRYKFPLCNEYKFKSPSQAKNKLAIQYINKVILVNKKQTIINANANMFNVYFENKLAKLNK
jgi:hypothetical protein